jgi:hypothetical protein
MRLTGLIALTLASIGSFGFAAAQESERFYDLSPETTPAKHSAENAAKDDRWWLDRTTAFTDEQKRAIYRALADRAAPAAAGAGLHPEPTSQLPAGVSVSELPDELKKQIPYLQGFKYLLAPDRKIVLVDPDDNAVAATIGPDAAPAGK